MEAEGTRKRVRDWFKQIPAWFQILFGTCSLIFALGTAYSELKSNTIRIQKVEEAQAQQAMMAGEISNLHVQIEQSNKTQEQTNSALGKLTDSVNDLSVSVGRLQGRIGDDLPKRKR